MNNKSKGFLAVIISGIIFGSMPLLAKIAYSSGSNPLNLAFWRFFIALPVLFIIIKRNTDISFKITKIEFKKILLLSILGYISTAILLFSSYNYISTGMATTIHFVYPILVIISSVIFFKQNINIIKSISVICCTLGIFFLYGGDSQVNIIGVILSFLSGITYAFYILYLDKSGLKDMNSIKLTFYLSSSASIIMFIINIYSNAFTININFSGWVSMGILSIAVALGSVNLLSIGIKIIGPQSASILSTFEPITSLIIGVLVFKELMSFKMLMGVILILTSVILITALDNKIIFKPRKYRAKHLKI